MAEYTMIPVERIFPHPDNPRKDLGDLSELSESIKASGILQNLTVVPGRRGTDEEIEHIKELLGTLTGDSEIERNAMKEIQAQIDNRWVADDYTAIIGHRRLAAAKLAGLTEVPCVVANLTPQEQVQTMLMENMQRSDLTAYEQAQGFQMMIDLGDTVEVVAQKTGFSETTIRRRLKMAELDQDTLREVSVRQLSLTDFDDLAQIEDISERNKVLKEIGTNNFKSEVARSVRTQKIKKVLPILKKQLEEAGAKEADGTKIYSNFYVSVNSARGHSEERLEEWDGIEPIIPQTHGKKLFYRLIEWSGELRFYEKRETPKAPPPSAEEKERARKINEAWATVDEQLATAYQLRADFVATLTLNKKNEGKMLRGAMTSIICEAIDYNGSNRGEIEKLCDFTPDGVMSRGILAVDAFLNSNAKSVPAIIYASFNDDKDVGNTSSYKGEFPKHIRRAKVVAIYDWLLSLGYVMSDDEKAMYDGTHEVFKRGEA